MSDDGDGGEQFTAATWDRFVGYPDVLFRVLTRDAVVLTRDVRDPLLDCYSTIRTRRRELLYMCAACRRVRDLFPFRLGAESIDWAEEQAAHESRTSEPPLGLGELMDIQHELPQNSLQRRLAFQLHNLILVGGYDCGDTDFSELLNALAEAVWVRRAPRPGDFEVAFDQLPPPVRAERVAQCELFRDIFYNPFRPVTFSPDWRTDTAVVLAQQMYDSRDFSAIPILADALQDAGCDNDDVLNHCRRPGEHVRGCWVVDLILGKS